jgi:hypothetical protein
MGLLLESASFLEKKKQKASDFFWPQALDRPCHSQ